MYRRAPFLSSLLLLLIALLLSLAIGSVFIPPAELWRVITGTSSSEVFRTIFLDIRLPRTILIAFVGAALAGSGAQYLIVVQDSILLNATGVAVIAGSVAMYFLELLIMVLQAFVFTLLTAIYIQGSLEADAH